MLHQTLDDIPYPTKCKVWIHVEHYGAGGVRLTRSVVKLHYNNANALVPPLRGRDSWT